MTASPGALREVDRQDKAWMITVGTHTRPGAPRQDVLDAFEKIGRGETVRLWTPINI